MKTNFLLLALVALLSLSAALPFKQKIALLNSLQVGREQDPMVWNCTGCSDDTKPIRSHVIEEPVQEVKAILSVYDQYTVLAFRYTATMGNVITDAAYPNQRQDQYAPQGCKVHAGFDKMWNAIREWTFSDLKDSVHTGRLIITGISLGGALSMLSYVDISHGNIFQNIEVITFGSPRVGNKKWAAWFDSITPNNPPMNFCLKKDDICFAPVCLLLCNYQHAGLPVTCEQSTKECTRSGSYSEFIENRERANYIGLAKEIVTEALTTDDSFGDILVHVNGYKNMSDYSYIA